MQEVSLERGPTEQHEQQLQAQRLMHNSPSRRQEKVRNGVALLGGICHSIFMNITVQMMPPTTIKVALPPEMTEPDEIHQTTCAAQPQ